MFILATSYKYVKSTKKMYNDINIQIRYYNKVHLTFADLEFVGRYDILHHEIRKFEIHSSNIF